MAARPRLVLVGAGHAHAVALRRWSRRSAADVDLVVVTDRPDVLYSGMVPGWIAGDYQRSELVMDARVMTGWVGGRLIIGRAVEIDAKRRQIDLADGTSVAYDVASLDVGSVIRVPEGPEPGACVSARRPDEMVRRLEAVGRGAVTVVGGGAAGVELAACIRARGSAAVTLIETEERLLGAYEPSVSARVATELTRRGVAVRLGSKVSDVTAGEVHLDGEALATELAIWATGASPPALLEASDLPTHQDGFVRVHEDLRVVGFDTLFAAGDCASPDAYDLPKAGVHAVRQGEVLFKNLVAAATAVRDGTGGGQGAGGSMVRYDPQSDFLTLLNLGDGTAIGTKWGYVVKGRWVHWLKDVIDQRFVDRFRE